MEGTFAGDLDLLPPLDMDLNTRSLGNGDDDDAPHSYSMEDFWATTNNGPPSIPALNSYNSGSSHHMHGHAYNGHGHGHASSSSRAIRAAAAANSAQV